MVHTEPPAQDHSGANPLRANIRRGCQQILGGVPAPPRSLHQPLNMSSWYLFSEYNSVDRQLYSLSNLSNSCVFVLHADDLVVSYFLSLSLVVLHFSCVFKYKGCLESIAVDIVKYPFTGVFYFSYISTALLTSSIVVNPLRTLMTASSLRVGMPCITTASFTSRSLGYSIESTVSKCSSITIAS
jgi:hypothetical protein